MPGGMSIRSGKILVTSPHRQIRESHPTDSHHLVLAVIQFVHPSLPHIQLFQSPEYLALFLTVTLLFAELLVALLIGPPLFRTDLLQFCINDSFALLDLPSQHVISHSLFFQCALVQTQFPVEFIAPTLVLFAQALMSFTGLLFSCASTLRPLPQAALALLQVGSSLRYLRVFHHHLGETVIRV